MWGDRNVIKIEVKNTGVLKFKDITIEIQCVCVCVCVYVACKNRSLANNNTGNWNNFKITQKILEQDIAKGPKQGTTESGHIVHCEHTSESANVQVHNVFNMRNNTTRSINCNYRRDARLQTLETWFVSGI
jgi:hypothetical protein